MTVPANVSRFSFEIIGEREPLLVLEFQIHEAISTPFRIELVVAAENPAVNLNDWLGKAGLLTLMDVRCPRRFHGELIAAQQYESGNRFTRYNIILVPKFSLLDYRRGCRIFQELSVPQIIQQVLTEAGIDTADFRLALKRRYAPREYCVQYQESELHFLSRLMETEGIFYFFEHHADRHTMVISDNNGIFDPIANHAQIGFHPKTQMRSDRATIYEFHAKYQVVSSRVTLADYQFSKPRLTLRAEACQPQSLQLESYFYPGCFQHPDQGQDYAAIRLQAQRLVGQTVSGKSDNQWLASGRLFQLTDHQRADVNREYLLLSVMHRGRQPQSLEEGAGNNGTEYITEFSGVPSQLNYRAPFQHDKPLIDGAQTAFVTGPKGEEIYTDQHGRIKVQFHWDREGQYNETTSCWVRVSQGWAGKEWGAFVLPRVGQEVIVHFVNGDPDRPMVTGCVYHGVNKAPYELPSDKTRTTFKSQSYPGGSGYNELRIEDKKGNEQIYVHGQKDMDLLVNHEYKEDIGKDFHQLIRGSRFEKVDNEQHLTVGGHLKQKVRENFSQTIGGDMHLKVSGSLMEQAERDIHIKAGTQLVIQSGTQLTLKGGAGFIVLDPSGVTIKGPMVRINSGGSAGSAKSASPASPQPPKAPETGKPGKQR